MSELTIDEDEIAIEEEEGEEEDVEEEREQPLEEPGEEEDDADEGEEEGEEGGAMSHFPDTAIQIHHRAGGRVLEFQRSISTASSTTAHTDDDNMAEHGEKKPGHKHMSAKERR